jgi:hypothetical protein
MRVSLVFTFRATGLTGAVFGGPDRWEKGIASPPFVPRTAEPAWPACTGITFAPDESTSEEIVLTRSFRPV